MAPPPLALGSWDLVGDFKQCGFFPGGFPYAPPFRLDVLGPVTAPNLLLWHNYGPIVGATAYDPTVALAPACKVTKGPLTLRSSPAPWSFAFDPASGAITDAVATWGPIANGTCGPQMAEEAFAAVAKPDATPPTFDLIHGSTAGLLLPWDRVKLTASEGIDAATWMVNVSATLGGVPITPSPVAVPGTNDVSTLDLAGGAWLDRVGKSLDITMKDTADGSGNVGPGVAANLTFADTGPLTAKIAFDGASQPFLVGLMPRPAGSPECETNLPCASGHWDGMAPVALAALVSTVGATKIVARVAVLTNAAMQLQVAMPDGTVQTAATAPGVGPIYQDLVVPVPPSTSQVGVALIVTEKPAACPTTPGSDVAIGTIIAE